MRLLSTSSLDITRVQEDTGYFTDEGDWVSGEATSASTIPIQCSIQPFRNGEEQTELPSGVRSVDAVYIYTKTPLKTNIEQTNQEADTTVIDGLEYECFDVQNWKRYGLSVDHYRAIFIRKDKLNGS